MNMKRQLLTKSAKWCYGLSAALLLCGVVLWLSGQHNLGLWVAIAGIAFAAGIAGKNIWRGF